MRASIDMESVLAYESSLASKHNKLNSLDLDHPENSFVGYIERKVSNPELQIILKSELGSQIDRDISGIPSLLYCKGDRDLLKKHNLIAIIGTRNNSEEGRRRTIKIVNQLVQEGFTIVSGLAAGIDTIALTEAMRLKQPVIAVIGTPIDKYYPRKNKDLQDEIARRHLLMSHVPFYQYENEHFRAHKRYFPERNGVMSSISDASLIIEASEKSGTRHQARYSIKQGKKLFVLQSLAQQGITWIMEHINKREATIVKSIDDILRGMNEMETI